METEEFLKQYDEMNDGGSDNKPSKKNTVVWVLGGLLLISLGFNIYQLKGNTDMSADLEQTSSVVLSLEDEKASLQTEFDRLTSEFEDSQKDLVDKNELLVQKDEEIARKQKEIQNILNNKNATEKDLREAKNLIASLNKEVNGYKEEIAMLTAEKDSLMAENETISEALASEKITSQIEREKAEAVETKMKSTFSISNFNIKGLKVRKSGKEVEKDRAKRVDKLQVSFELDPNFNAEDGQKELFIAIFTPDGKLGKFKNANPGTITTNSGVIEYSDKVVFDYTSGSKEKITFDWEDYEFKKGMYAIDIYQNGLKIGQKVIELK